MQKKVDLEKLISKLNQREYRGSWTKIASALGVTYQQVHRVLYARRIHRMETIERYVNAAIKVIEQMDKDRKEATKGNIQAIDKINQVISSVV